MSLERYYREAMALNEIRDMAQREIQAQAFFKKLNAAQLPDKFNWAAEIFEGIHVKERGDQPALIWTDLETDAEQQFTYRQLAANGNKLLNFLGKKGVEKGNNLYMLTPIVPETWFATFASIKGGLICVPTATSMTERELQFRFDAYKPDVIVAFEGLADLVDDALKKVGHTPKAKVVLGQKDGWLPYAEVSGEAAEAQAADVASEDVLFCFFTSGHNRAAQTGGAQRRILSPGPSFLRRHHRSRTRGYPSQPQRTGLGQMGLVQLLFSPERRRHSHRVQLHSPGH